MLKRIIQCFVILGVLIVNYGCSKDEGPSPRKITGTFNLYSVEISGSKTEPYSTYSFSESIMTDCDTYNTIEFKSNETLELKEFSGNNCTNQSVRNGTWEFYSVRHNVFFGKVKFSDSDVEYDLFESEYSDDVTTKFRLEYYDENPPENIKNLRYHYTFIRADL